MEIMRKISDSHELKRQAIELIMSSEAKSRHAKHLKTQERLAMITRNERAMVRSTELKLAQASIAYQDAEIKRLTQAFGKIRAALPGSPWRRRRSAWSQLTLDSHQSRLSQQKSESKLAQYNANFGEKWDAYMIKINEQAVVKIEEIRKDLRSQRTELLDRAEYHRVRAASAENQTTIAAHVQICAQDAVMPVTDRPFMRVIEGGLPELPGPFAA